MDTASNPNAARLPPHDSGVDDGPDARIHLRDRDEAEMNADDDSNESLANADDTREEEEEEKETEARQTEPTEDQKTAAIELYQLVIGESRDEAELVQMAETIITKDPEILKMRWDLSIFPGHVEDGDDHEVDGDNFDNHQDEEEQEEYEDDISDSGVTGRVTIGSADVRFVRERQPGAKKLSSFLHIASKNGRVGCVKLFLQHVTTEKEIAFALCPNSEGYSPLHYAVMRSNVELVQLLVDSMNGIAPYIHSYPSGLLPLHQARTPEIVNILMKAAPKTIEAKDALGMLPLHRILCEDVPLTTIEFLVDAFPESLSTPSRHHNTPLQVALGKSNCQMREESLRYVLKRCPELLRNRSTFGLRLLHSGVTDLIQHGDPPVLNGDGILELGVHARNLKIIFEEGLNNGYYSAEEGGGLLDDAVANSMTMPFLMETLPEYARAQFAKTNPQSSPLGSFVRRSKKRTLEWKQWRLVFERVTETPFLQALIENSSYWWKYLPKLIDQFSLDLLSKDSKGRTALIVAIHALTTTPDLQVPSSDCLIKMTIGQTHDTNDSADSEKVSICPASVKDENGRYPLHVACEQGLFWKHGMEDVLQANVRALQSIDPVSRLYPSMLACSGQKCNLSSGFELLRAKPNVVEH